MYPYYCHLVEKFQTSKHRNNETKTYPCNIGGYAHRLMVKSLAKGLLKKNIYPSLNCSTFVIILLHKKK